MSSCNHRSSNDPIRTLINPASLGERACGTHNVLHENLSVGGVVVSWG